MTDEFTLTTQLVHLAEDLAVRSYGIGNGDWTNPDRPELQTGRLVCLCSYAATWDTQERHPSGDEFVYVLDGAVELLVEAGDRERALPLARGQAGIIPAGRWHRFALRVPSTMLFITPTPAMTEHRACRAG